MNEQDYNRATPETGQFTAHPASGGFVTVLHVDDDPNDTALLQAASRRAGVAFQLQNVQDGEQAIAYLSGEGPYASRASHPMPSLVLLDLKMPRATGFEILPPASRSTYRRSAKWLPSAT